MNSKLLVTLLTKNIDELRLITEGFEESAVYSGAIIQLAKRKTEDIQLLLDELARYKTTVKAEEISAPEVTKVIIPEMPSVIEAQNVAERVEKPLNIELNEVQNEQIDDSNFVDVTETIETTTTETIEVETIQIDTFDDEEQHRVIEHSVVVEENIKVEETKKITIAEKMSQNSSSRNDAMSHKDHSLSATIANKKIEDIKQAISIGDRFRFQRELFKSNGEEMNKTLTYINQLATFTEAEAFLKSKYNWSDDADAVIDFMQIVHRKFS